MSHKSVPQECPTRVSHKSFLQECHTRVSRKSVLQECPTRVTHKSVLQECPTRVSHKSIPQEFPTRVSHKECPTRVSCKSDPQECPTRVSHKRVSHKSDPQECPTRVSHESVRQECPTRVSYKSVPQGCPTRVSFGHMYIAVRSCLHSGSWAPSCLSFRFGACTAVFCPVRWNSFTCESLRDCIAATLCNSLSALFSFSGKRWMNDRIGFRRRGSDLSGQLGRRAYVRHQKSISCHILSSCFYFLFSRGQLPAD